MLIGKKTNGLNFLCLGSMGPYVCSANYGENKAKIIELTKENLIVLKPSL